MRGSLLLFLFLPAIANAQLPYSIKEPNINENEEFLYQEIRKRDNTNLDDYIQLRDTLQSGATFYVSSASVDGQTILARTSGNVGIGTATPQSKLSFGGTEPFIGMATTDGADTSVLKIGGGGAGADYTRGGRVELYGNEHPKAGSILIEGGGVTGGDITFAVNGSTQVIVDQATTISTGGALCLNASRILTKCTSAVDASGNCTCP